METLYLKSPLCRLGAHRCQQAFDGQSLMKSCSNALERTLPAYEPRGANKAERVRDAAANSIVEAYNQGVRDEEHLAHYALKASMLKSTE